MWDLIVSVPDHCLSFYIVTQILLQALAFTKWKILFNSSLKSDRNVVSQLTLTYSLIAVVSYETNFLLSALSSYTTFLCILRHFVSKCETQMARNAFYVHPSVT